jgi:hypothetical protein
VHKPQGYGPGTAGIVSIRNEQQTFLTENYYLQLGHEIGIAGLLLFLFISYQVIRYIDLRDEQNRSLIAVFVGYCAMAMLMHLWSNEAVAAQWWLLIGLCLGWTVEKS